MKTLDGNETSPQQRLIHLAWSHLSRTSPAFWSGSAFQRYVDKLRNTLREEETYMTKAPLTTSQMVAIKTVDLVHHLRIRVGVVSIHAKNV